MITIGLDRLVEQQKPIEWDMTLTDRECEVAIEQHVWITADHRRISVAAMETRHIVNCIRAFNSGKIPIQYLGGRTKWLEIFNEELNRRNING